MKFTSTDAAQRPVAKYNANNADDPEIIYSTIYATTSAYIMGEVSPSSAPRFMFIIPRQVNDVAHV